MFHGKKFTDEIHELPSTRKKIKSYGTRFLKSTNHIKAVYNGVENNDISMIILGVIDEKLIEEKDDVTYGTYVTYRSALIKFKKQMNENQNLISVWFGIILKKLQKGS